VEVIERRKEAGSDFDPQTKDTVGWKIKKDKSLRGMGGQTRNGIRRAKRRIAGEGPSGNQEKGDLQVEDHLRPNSRKMRKRERKNAILRGARQKR